jgi:hypothetical protein
MLSRGAAGAERSELALYSVVGYVASTLRHQIGDFLTPEREKNLPFSSLPRVTVLTSTQNHVQNPFWIVFGIPECNCPGIWR